MSCKDNGEWYQEEECTRMMIMLMMLMMLMMLIMMKEHRDLLWCDDYVFNYSIGSLLVYCLIERYNNHLMIFIDCVHLIWKILYFRRLLFLFLFLGLGLGLCLWLLRLLILLWLFCVRLFYASLPRYISITNLSIILLLLFCKIFDVFISSWLKIDCYKFI